MKPKAFLLDILNYTTVMWLKEKASRLNHKESRPRNASVSTSSSDDNQTDSVFNLDGWEEWMSEQV